MSMLQCANFNSELMHGERKNNSTFHIYSSTNQLKCADITDISDQTQPNDCCDVHSHMNVTCKYLSNEFKSSIHLKCQ